MGWNEAFKIVITAFVSVGGAGAIILGLSNWLGKLWAGRLMEKEKQEHRMVIERYKSDLEKIKASFLRYSSKQFELYNGLWIMLCDIKFSKELSQNEFTAENLADYLMKIEVAEREIEKSLLFLDEDHYSTFIEILNELKIIRERRLKVHSVYNEILETNEKDWDKIIEEKDFSKNHVGYCEALTRFMALMNDFGGDLRKKLSSEK